MRVFSWLASPMPQCLEYHKKRVFRCKHRIAENMRGSLAIIMVEIRQTLEASKDFSFFSLTGATCASVALSSSEPREYQPLDSHDGVLRHVGAASVRGRNLPVSRVLEVDPILDPAQNSDKSAPYYNYYVRTLCREYV